VLGVSASRISLAAWILALAALAAPSARATLWVSPAGDDRSPGSEEEPVRTLARARDIVRGLNRDMADDITVFIVGAHHLEQPLAFGPEDAASNGYSIIYTAAPGEHPVVTGAIRVAGWTVADAARNLWSAPVPEGASPARDLYVNGTPVNQTCGRLLQFFSKNAGANAASQPDPTANWKNLSDVAFEPVEPGGLWSEREGGGPVFARNAFELLGKPGQWYFDRPARRLYYTPRPGEDMATADVEAPVTSGLVTVRGSAEHPVAGLIFKGIRFEYAARGDPKDAGAAAAVAVSYAGGVQFLEDEFLHMGSAALQVGPAVAAAGIDGSLFADIGGSAVRIAGASQVRIADSRFTYAAAAHPSDGVIEVEGSQDVTIEHSQVDHYPREAVLRTGAPSGTILEDSNLIAPPTIAFHGTPAAEARAASQGDVGVPQAYQGLLTETVSAPTVPQAPVGVAAEAEDEFAYVTWMPSCLDGGSPVLSYTVESTTGAKVTVSADDFMAKGYIVFGDLGNGRAVSFTVTASSATGSSAPSLPTAAIKPQHKRKLRPPAAPASVSVTTGASGVRIKIVPPPSDGGSPVISYAVNSDADAERDVLEGLDVIYADATHPIVRRIDGISATHASTVTIVAINASGESDPAAVKLR
jgi:hypothetical protein